MGAGIKPPIAADMYRGNETLSGTTGKRRVRSSIIPCTVARSRRLGKFPGGDFRQRLSGRIPGLARRSVLCPGRSPLAPPHGPRDRPRPRDASHHAVRLALASGGRVARIGHRGKLSPAGARNPSALGRGKTNGAVRARWSGCCGPAFRISFAVPAGPCAAAVRAARPARMPCSRDSWNKASASAAPREFRSVPGGVGKKTPSPASIDRACPAATACWSATARYWHWLLERRAYDQFYVALDGPDLWDFKESSTRLVGYAAIKGEKIVELVTAPERRKAAMELLARACGDAIEQDHRRHLAARSRPAARCWAIFATKRNRCRFDPESVFQEQVRAAVSGSRKVFEQVPACRVLHGAAARSAGAAADDVRRVRATGCRGRARPAVGTRVARRRAEVSDRDCRPRPGHGRHAWAAVIFA